MNRHVSDFHRALIDLAITPPITLGRLTIRPAALEVEGGGRTVRMKPGCMRVLLALVQAQGEVLSRDELLNRCWGGRIVSDSAINRSVLEVRQALAAEPRAQIESIIKIGYRLTFSTAEQPEVAVAAQGPARRNPWLVVGGAVLAAGAVAGAVTLATRPSSGAWAATALRPLTSEPGREGEPAVSADGRFLAYSAVRPDGGGRAIMLRSVAQDAPVALTGPEFDAGFPAWSPDGQRLAFVRRTAGPCEIWIVPALGGAPRLAGRCAQAEATRVSWADGGTLLFSDAAGPYAPSRLRALDVETGAVRDLTAPPAATHGDSEPVVSPDGRRVLFNRTVSYGVENLHVGDLRDGRLVEVRPLNQDGWKAPGAVWSADGRTVFFTSNRGGDRGLWAVDARRRNPTPERVSLGVAQFGRLSGSGAGQLAAEVVRSWKNLSWLTGAGTAEISASTSSHWDPDITADGAVAYVSTQTGAPELFVAEPGARAARLTELRRSYLHGPRWSPDGQRLAFVTIVDRDAQVYVVGRRGDGLRQVSRDPGDKREPAFARGGRSLLYIHWRPEGPVLAETPLEGGPSKPLLRLGVGWRSLKAGGDGAFYALRSGDARLWRISPDLAEATPVNGAPAIGPRDSWTVSGDGVYVARTRADGQADLRFKPWTGPPRTAATLPGAGAAPIFAVHPATGAILFERTVEDEGDIVRVSLSRG